MNTEQVIEYLKEHPSEFSRLVSSLPREFGKALAEGDLVSVIRAEPYAMQLMARAEPYAFAKNALLPDTIDGLERALNENPAAAQRLGVTKQRP